MAALVQAPSVAVQAETTLQTSVRSQCPEIVAQLEALVADRRDSAKAFQTAFDQIEALTDKERIADLRFRSIFPTSEPDKVEGIGEDLGRCFYRARLLARGETPKPVVERKNVQWLTQACRSEFEGEAAVAGKDVFTLAVMLIDFLRYRSRAALEDMVKAPLAPKDSKSYTSTALLRCGATYHLGLPPVQGAADPVDAQATSTARARSACAVQIIAFERAVATDPKSSPLVSEALEDLDKRMAAGDVEQLQRMAIIPTPAAKTPEVTFLELGRCFARERLVERGETPEPILDMAMIDGFKRACDEALQAESKTTNMPADRIALLSVASLRNRDRQALEEVIALPVGAKHPRGYTVTGLSRCAASYHLALLPAGN